MSLWPTSCNVLIIGNVRIIRRDDFYGVSLNPLGSKRAVISGNVVTDHSVLFVWLFREAQGRLKRPTTSLFPTDKTADFYVSLERTVLHDACPFCSVISAYRHWTWLSNSTSDRGTVSLYCCPDWCFASEFPKGLQSCEKRGSTFFVWNVLVKF